MADEVKPQAPEGAVNEVVKPEVQQDGQEWQNDPRLDENGNPKEEQVVVETPPVEETPTEEVPTEPTEEPEKPEPSKFDFEAPIVKQVEGLIADAGLDPKKVAEAVTKNGGKLPPELAKAIVEKHGEVVAALVADKLGTFHEGAKQQNQEREKKVFTKLEDAFKDVTTQSGRETWNELKTWAKDNVPANERKEINSMLAQGGYAAELALDALVNKFKSKPVTDQAPELEHGASDVSTGIQPLTKAEYLAKFEELESKGHVYGESREFIKLDAQRLAGRKRGI